MLAESHVIRISAGAGRLGSEQAFDVLARARELEAQGRDIIHLEVGEPDFDTPEHVKRAGIEALEANQTHYTPSAGVALLRDTIADYASRFRGVPAFAREGYSFFSINPAQAWDMLSYPGFIKMSTKYWKMGVGEIYRDLVRARLGRA